MTQIIGDGGHTASIRAVLAALKIDLSGDERKIIGHGNIQQRFTDYYDNHENIRGFIAKTAITFGFVEETAQVFEMAFVGARSIVGENCIINTRATIEHDCVIGAHSHVAPGAVICGGVIVGERTLVGAGAVIHPGLKIGKNCVIGCGSVVVEHVSDNRVVKGNPAR